jgi:plastocyanin
MTTEKIVGVLSVVVGVLSVATMTGTFSHILPASAQQSNSNSTQTGGNTTTGTQVSIVQGASTMADKAFSPNPVAVKVGDTVTWTNDDNQFHTVTSGNPSGGGETGKVFDSGTSGPTALITKGKTFSHTFAEKGEFPYFCQLHPTMVGKVIVS